MERSKTSAIWLLVGVVLAVSCTGPALRDERPLESARVKVGVIDAARLGDALTALSASEPLPEQLEDLFDRFWEAGCAGETFHIPNPINDEYPQIVCRLPGRSRDGIFVTAHLDLDPSPSGVSSDRGSAASLLALYRSLGSEPRAHTFVFVGFAELPGRNRIWSSVRRTAEALGTRVRAVVDLRRLRSGYEGVWSLSPDPKLRDDFAAVAGSLSWPAETLRVLTPRTLDESLGRTRPSRAQLPMITIGTFGSEDTPGAEAGAERGTGTGARAASTPGAGEDLVRVVRLVAFFLGYLDQALASADPAPPEQVAPPPPQAAAPE